MLRFIPGTAQDVRAYFLTHAVLAGRAPTRTSSTWCGILVDRYADGPRRGAARGAGAAAPVEYPELGVYHPR
jgi:magnesium chelatase subunit H